MQNLIYPVALVISQEEKRCELEQTLRLNNEAVVAFENWSDLRDALRSDSFPRFGSVLSDSPKVLAKIADGLNFHAWLAPLAKATLVFEHSGRREAEASAALDPRYKKPLFSANERASA